MLVVGGMPIAMVESICTVAPMRPLSPMAKAKPSGSVWVLESYKLLTESVALIKFDGVVPGNSGAKAPPVCETLSVSVAMLSSRVSAPDRVPLMRGLSVGVPSDRSTPTLDAGSSVSDRLDSAPSEKEAVSVAVVG